MGVSDIVVELGTPVMAEGDLLYLRAKITDPCREGYRRDE